MSPGSLLLDERTPAAVVAELQKRHHLVEMRTRLPERGGAGDDPAHAGRVDRSRRGPVLLPGVAGVVGPLFDEPGGFDRDGTGATACGRSRARRSISAAVPGSTRAGWGRFTARALSFARAVFEEAVRGRMPEGIRRDVPHGVRRFRLLPVPDRGILAPAVPADAGALPVRLQGAGTDHLQGVSGARAVRAAGGQGERGVPGPRGCSRRCSCVRCCRTARRRRC